MKKFVRKRVRKYGLRSQNFISYFKAEKLLKSKGIVLNDRNKNCLYMHNSRESMKHWFVKTLLFKILRRKGRTVGTEIETKRGIVDLIDVNNLIVYEIESNLTEKIAKEKINQFNFAKDVFLVDVKKIPNDLNKAEKCLRKIVI